MNITDAANIVYGGIRTMDPHDASPPEPTPAESDWMQDRDKLVLHIGDIINALYDTTIGDDELNKLLWQAEKCRDMVRTMDCPDDINEAPDNDQKQHK